MGLDGVVYLLSSVPFRLSEGEYEAIADETLESLADKFDALPEQAATGSEYDVQLSVCISFEKSVGNA